MPRGILPRVLKRIYDIPGWDRFGLNFDSSDRARELKKKQKKESFDTMKVRVIPFRSPPRVVRD